jgi:microcystin-dependent protein
MDPFLAEIRILPYNFAPLGWALCNGQLIPISQNTALFSLLGINYGGNGQTNFALPNLQGRAPMHPGQGPGLSLHDLGETGGTETVTLLASEMPQHNHSLMASGLNSQATTPIGTITGRGNPPSLYASGGPLVNMASATIVPIGGTQPHNNMMPFLTYSFSIALQGVYPPRT